MSKPSIGLTRARRAAVILWPASRERIERIAVKLADFGFPCPGDDAFTWLRRIDAELEKEHQQSLGRARAQAVRS
jgi:hypothetical protein